MEIIGAEAVVKILENKVIKTRVKKNYRNRELDSFLNSTRMKNEVRLLKKAKMFGVNVPKILSVSDSSIIMSRVFGESLKDCLTSKVMKLVGIEINKLHELGLIHGDLTTTNIMINDGEVFFIDFGLGFESEKVEEKAVDLHVLEESVNSIKPKESEELLNSLIMGYGNIIVLKQLKKVKSRGKYK